MTATLSGWSCKATPSTANGGYYSGGWNPYGVVDNVASGSPLPYQHQRSRGSVISRVRAITLSSITPENSITYGSVVGGAQPGASLTMTTTGISATAVTGSTYTATIEYANVSWSNGQRQPPAQRCAQHPGRRRGRRHGHPIGAGQGSPWTPVTATWVATQLTLVKPSSSRWSRTTSWRGRKHATMAGAYFGFDPRHSDDHGAKQRLPAAPSGLTATAVSSSQINLSLDG